MLSTLLVVVGRAAPLLLVLLVLASAVGGWLLLRSSRPSRGVVGGVTAASGAAVLALTLYPDSSAPGPFCTVDLSWPALGAIDGLANAVLFLPLAFFATVATRRPFAVALAGSGLSALIELTQALLPVLHRSCDTGDWTTNTVGTAAGALLAWWIGVLARITPRRRARAVEGDPDGPRSTSAADTRARRIAWGSSIVLGALLVGWAVRPVVAPPPRVLDACQERAAGAPTLLDGGYAVTAGISGRLCVRSPSGTGAYPADVEPGPQGVDGRWEVGIELPGTRTAADSRGAQVRLHPVAGSDLLVWSAETP